MVKLEKNPQFIGKFMSLISLRDVELMDINVNWMHARSNVSMGS